MDDNTIGWAGLPPSFSIDDTDERYTKLHDILEEAYDFAAHGKGEQRHGHGRLDWKEQRHAAIGREVGTGFAIGQAVKKSYESEGLDPEPAVRELLGAITYLASAIYMIREGHR